MFIKSTRRAFLSNTAMAMAASKLPVDLYPERATDNSLPPRQTNFDDDWKFSKGDVQGAHLTYFSDENWSTVILPHDWSIEGPFNKDTVGGETCAYLPTGIGWYRKQFTSPPTAARQKTFIQFDGVYQRSEVWINAHSLGMRPNGYVSFVYDLTTYLHVGRQSNVLAVRVDNSLQPNSRWYSGSGIYRHTWLITTAPLHIAHWVTCVRTPEVSGESAFVEITTRVQNDLSQAAPSSLHSFIQDKDGKTIQEATMNAEIDADSDFVFTQRIKLPSPRLWSTDMPYLYSVRQVLERDGQTADTTTTPFGVRSICFDVDKGFLLNNKHVKSNGVCLHSDGGAVGAAVPEAIWQRRLALLKEMGCNAIRCSHNPPAPEFLDLCDTMGFMVMFDTITALSTPIAMVTLHVSRRAAADQKLAFRNSADHIRYTYRANLSGPGVPETQQKLRHADIATTINMVETRSECDQVANAGRSRW